MSALVIYESMFGNTRVVAEAIAEGLGHEARAVPVGAVTRDELASAALVVVGGPTHAFGIARPKTRAAASQEAMHSKDTLPFEGDVTGTGLREWIGKADLTGRTAAAFDTRVRTPIPTPRAAPKIARALRRRGAQLAAMPQGFWVGKDNRLENGQVGMARDFGQHLAQLALTGPQHG